MGRREIQGVRAHQGVQEGREGQGVRAVQGAWEGQRWHYQEEEGVLQAREAQVEQVGRVAPGCLCWAAWLGASGPQQVQMG